MEQKKSINADMYDQYFDFFNDRARKSEINGEIATLLIAVEPLEGKKMESVNILMGNSQTISNAIISLGEKDKNFADMIIASAAVLAKHRVEELRERIAKREPMVGELMDEIKNIIKNGNNDSDNSSE